MLHRHDIDILQRIAATKPKIPDRRPRSLPVSGPPVESCAFPAPRPITDRLLALGLSRRIAEQASALYIDISTRLRDDCHAQYRRTTQAYLRIGQGECFYDPTKSQALLQNVYMSQFTTMLKNWSDNIVARFERRIFELRELQNCSAWGARKASRCAFNQNAVPMLEQFFETNSRPSREEKSALASKTNMEYRQINVWFQNRRRRSKMDCPKSQSTGASSLFPASFDQLLSTMLSEVLPSQADSYGERKEDNTMLTPGPSFNLERPSHAFPSSYPPSCSYNPFPLRKEDRVFTTSWRRTFRSQTPRRSDVDVTELTVMLSQVCLDGELETVGHSESPKEHSYPSPWALSSASCFTSIPPRAPLPALVRPMLSAACRASSLAFDVCAPFSATMSLSHRNKYREGRKKRKIPKPAQVEPAVLFAVSDGVASTALNSRTESFRSPSYNGCIRCPASSHPAIPAAADFRSEIPPNVVPTPLVTSPHSSSVHFTPYPRRLSSARKKTAAILTRIPSGGTAVETAHGSSAYTASSYSHSLSRMSSNSSIRSVSSNSSSSSDFEGPITPPSLPLSLSTPPTSPILAPLEKSVSRTTSIVTGWISEISSVYDELGTPNFDLPHDLLTGLPFV